MMYYIGKAFVISVFTNYTFYRYVFQQNDYFRELVWIESKWQIFVLIYTLAVVSISSFVKKEVSIYTTSEEGTGRLVSNIFYTWEIGTADSSYFAWYNQLFWWFRSFGIGMELSFLLWFFEPFFQTKNYHSDLPYILIFQS